MANFDPEPATDALTDEQEAWAQEQDTRTRIRAVVTGLREPATAATVAERANCSTNAARKHLEEFVELGLAQHRHAETGAHYIRNEAYFRWRRANELATRHTVEQLLDKLGDLEARDQQYKNEFAADSPDEVPLPAEATHANLESRLQTLSEWQTIREAIDRHKDALRIARREDGQLPA